MRVHDFPSVSILQILMKVRRYILSNVEWSESGINYYLDVLSSTSVLTVTATDPDGSDTLIYDIVSSTNAIGGSYFSINPQTGEIITAGDLDREVVAVVDLLVIATDTAGHNVSVY